MGTDGSTWRGEFAVLAGTIPSVGLSRLFGESSWVFGYLPDKWVLDWGVGIFYALTVLWPLGWRRKLSFWRTLGATALSILAWHGAVQLAANGYSASSSNEDSIRFLGRSVVAGFLGAAAVALAPLGRARGWERHLGLTAAVGGLCGGQMGLLCLWNFKVGFWLGMFGWQFAVTASLLYGTARQRTDFTPWWILPQLN